MSKAVKERKYLKRHTNNGIEVRRRMEQVERKYQAQLKADPVIEMRRALFNRPVKIYEGQ